MPKRNRSTSWTILHSGIIILCTTSLLSGLRIAALTRPELQWLSSLLPQGNVHQAHLISAAGLISVIVGYLLLPRSERRHRFRHGRYHHRVTLYGYTVLVSSVASGALLYFGIVPGLHFLHYYFALCFVVYLFLHAAVMFVQYGWKILYPLLRMPGLRRADTGVLLSVAGSVAFFALWFQQGTDPRLAISRIELTEIIEIDGLANEAVWNRPQALTIQTYGGANFIDGKTAVTVKSLHNGVEAFFHISWQDPTESLRHLPIQKTAGRWQVLENGYYRFNETSWYEDKFAIMLANNCESGGSDTARLGPNPLKDKPPNWHGSGYHYADDGQVRDIWHWKAVRTNDMYLADDNFFGAADIARDGQRRYTAGYLPDGKESGAYVMNWQWYKPDGVIPRRLPKPGTYQLAAITTLESTERAIPWYDYQPYREADDHYPDGSVLPSVLQRSNRFEGDRADVRARGVWRDGRWSLELVRPLNTGSDKDIVIETGVCFWVSAFDHSQIAHTRHARPARLILE